MHAERIRNHLRRLPGAVRSWVLLLETFVFSNGFPNLTALLFYTDLSAWLITNSIRKESIYEKRIGHE